MIGAATGSSGNPGEIQASTVMHWVGLRLSLSGTSTYWLVPFRSNARPTLPAAKVAPLRRVPGLWPMTSEASPSPGHQLTRPAGVAAPLGRAAGALSPLDVTPRRPSG